MTTMVIGTLIAIPSMASAQGLFKWTVSASNSDPNVQTGPDGTGFNTVHLWFAESCNITPEAGMSAADIGLKMLGDWSFLAFNTSNGFLNAGQGTSLLLAVGGCPDAPIAAGSILASGTAGGVNLTVGTLSGTASTVDCQINPAQYFWPEQVRFVGFQTTGYTGIPQDHGTDCGKTSVEENSWGSVKSLYR
jgi:hypothetical protein